ncbi:MAG: putative beta-lysine N-acetyltransferase [Trichlorobacter sp.]
MTDTISTIGDSTIQHGPYNDRIYLMKLVQHDCPTIIDTMDSMARTNGYSKIFAKVPARSTKPFLEGGYEIEATIPDFFQGDDACFLGKYFTKKRKTDHNAALAQNVLAAALEQSLTETKQLPPGLICRIADRYDADDMAEIYRAVFASYPFPIDDPGYLRENMHSTVFFGIWEGQRLVALSSAELDRETRCTEMTDFATLESYRSQGLALYLLQQMEREMGLRGIRTFYTIARAYSHGMNRTFAKNGYTYAGTLTNNTQISGGLESMNVWYKRQPGEPTGQGTAYHCPTHAAGTYLKEICHQEAGCSASGAVAEHRLRHRLGRDTCQTLE